MTLKLITVLVMFVISSEGKVETFNPEQDVKTGENCEYPPSCSVCFEDIANVTITGKYAYDSESLLLGDFIVS